MENIGALVDHGHDVGVHVTWSVDVTMGDDALLDWHT